MKQLFFFLLMCLLSSINVMAIESSSNYVNYASFYGVGYNIEGTLVYYDLGTQDAHSEISYENGYAIVTSGSGINGIVNIIPCFEFGDIHYVWDYTRHEWAYDYINDGWIYTTTWSLVPVTIIAHDAFLRNDNIKEVTIPYSIKKIQQNAFCLCTKLTKVSIAASSIEIGNDAFGSCRALKELNLPSIIESIGDNAFSGCTALKEVNLPLYIINAGKAIFSGTGIEEVNIPDTWSVIPERIFSATNLKSITIPSGVDTIKSRAFSRCFDLETIYWNAKNCVTNRYAWDYAPFLTCSKLSHLYIGESVESIGDYMFQSCFENQDDTITCYAKVPPIATYSTFIYCYDAVLCVPKSSLELYKTTEPWSRFRKIIGIVSLGDVDGDGKVNINDVTTLIDLLLRSGEIPEGADVDGDGKINISDVTCLIEILLSGN